MAIIEKNNLELDGISKKRGRPFTGHAKTNAQRQAAYRLSLRSESFDVMKDLSVPKLSALLLALDRFVGYVELDADSDMRECVSQILVEINNRYGDNNLF